MHALYRILKRLFSLDDMGYNTHVGNVRKEISTSSYYTDLKFFAHSANLQKHAKVCKRVRKQNCRESILLDF